MKGNKRGERKEKHKEERMNSGVRDDKRKVEERKVRRGEERRRQAMRRARGAEIQLKIN